MSHVFIYRGYMDGEPIKGTILGKNRLEAVMALQEKHAGIVILEMKRKIALPRPGDIQEMFRSAKKQVESQIKRASKKDAVKLKDIVKKLDSIDVMRPFGSDQAGAGEEELDLFAAEKEPERPKFRKKDRVKKILREQRVSLDGLERPEVVTNATLPPKEIQHFARKFSLLISSGVSMSQSLIILYNYTANKSFKKVLHVIYDDIQQGYPLSYAMMRFPRLFNSLFVALIVVGETSGTIDKCLIDMADFLQIQQKIKQSVKSAVIYPRIVGVVMVILMVLASYYFIPMFSELMREMEVPLPALTRFIFAFSDHVTVILPVGFLIIVALYLVLRFVKPVGEAYLYMKDFLSLKLPVIKNFTVSVCMFSFSHTLALMIRNGIKMLDALELARDAMPNRLVQFDVEDAMAQVTEGVSLSQSLSSQPYFDMLVCSLVNTGEESGKLDDALSQASDFYSVQVKEQLELLVQWVQPLSILLIAGVVLPVIFAIFIPMLNLTSGNVGGV